MIIWLKQIRAPFLILSVVLTAVGGAAAWDHGVFKTSVFILCMMGVVLAHIGVNLFNEWSDYQTGIDHQTERTPFSGGSGNLQKGLTRPDRVLEMAWLTLGTAGIIGIFLAWQTTWWIIPIMMVGGLTAVFYTSHLARWSLGEVMAGLTLGTLVILGTYLAMAGKLEPDVLWISISPGILTALLLFLNEFPDAEADKKGGRRHGVIVLGQERAARLYAIAMIVQYLLFLIPVLLGILPKSILLVFLTLPLAWKAMKTVFVPDLTIEEITPALGANVGVVIGCNLLAAVGYLTRPFFL